MVGVLLGLAILFTGCNSSASDQDIQNVREDYLGGQRTATIGDSFDRLFDSPKWSKETSAKGEVFVVFTGKISERTDKLQAALDDADKFYKKNDWQKLSELLETILGDVNSPELNAYKQPFYDSIKKQEQIESELAREKENKLADMQSTFSQKRDTLESDIITRLKPVQDKIKSLLQEQKNELLPYEQEFSKVNSEYSSYRGMGLIKGSTPEKERENSEQLRGSVGEKARNVLAKREQLSRQIEEIKNKYKVQLSDLKTQEDSLLNENSKLQSQISQEMNSADAQIEQEYKNMLRRRIDTEYKPFEEEQNRRRYDAAVQIIKNTMPKRGAPVKIIWLKYSTPNTPQKFGYALNSIEMDGKPRLGFLLAIVLHAPSGQ